MAKKKRAEMDREPDDEEEDNKIMSGKYIYGGGHDNGCEIGRKFSAACHGSNGLGSIFLACFNC